MLVDKFYGVITTTDNEEIISPEFWSEQQIKNWVHDWQHDNPGKFKEMYMGSKYTDVDLDTLPDIHDLVFIGELPKKEGGK